MTVEVKGHASTIRKRLKNYGLFGRIARRKHLLSKKLQIASEKPQDLWKDVLWVVKTKVKMLGIMYNTTFQEN